jgi:hypothetical protein
MLMKYHMFGSEGSQDQTDVLSATFIKIFYPRDASVARLVDRQTIVRAKTQNKEYVNLPPMAENFRFFPSQVVFD